MNWLIQMAVHYLLAQLASVGTSVNWDDVKAKANAYVATFVPAWLQPTVDGVVDGTIDAVAAALTDTADLQAIVDDLTAKDWNKALTDLEALLQKAVHPQAAVVACALQGLKVAA